MRKLQITKISFILCLMILVGVSLSFAGCDDQSGGLKDGYYTAETSNPDHGWFEILTICVSNGKIVSADYKARNDSGFIKAWDMDYMRVMNAVDGTYPNRYSRVYMKEFLDSQDSNIDVLTGATSSYNKFTLLSAAVIKNAETGNTDVVLIEIPEEHE